jgi:hypothetical protein
MTKVTSFASLTLLLLLTLSGCTEVRKCRVGEDGCIDEPPDDGKCAAGLELKGGKCVEPSGGSSGGRCNCAIDEICDEDGKTCLAYCEPIEDPPQASPTPPSCIAVKTASNPNPADLTFRELCTATCMQNCVRAQTFCPGFVCNERECEGEDALLRCNMECPGMNTDCLETRCFERSMTKCTDFTCPGSATRNCQDINCSDSCTGNTNDGFCDDGDPNSATYSFCAYGKDCTDCGPRRGTTRPPRLPLGDPCPEGQDVSCDGYNDDFLKTEAWCLPMPESDGGYRCVPSCTTEDGAGDCADDYECAPVTNAAGEIFRDAVNGTAGYACVPIICE